MGTGLRFGLSATFRLRSATQVCEPSNGALARPLERLDEAGGLFRTKRNRGQTDGLFLALVVIAPAFGAMRYRGARTVSWTNDAT